MTTEHVNYGETFVHDENFPKHSDRFAEFNFLREEDQEELPTAISDLYHEVRSAFDSNASILAGIGLRTLVEAICLQQQITGNTLVAKINNLQAKGILSPAEKPILDKLREIGNASAHQIKVFPLDKLGYALEIVNHVLRSIYILPKLNKKLKIK